LFLAIKGIKVIKVIKDTEATKALAVAKLSSGVRTPKPQTT